MKILCQSLVFQKVIEIKNLRLCKFFESSSDSENDFQVRMDLEFLMLSSVGSRCTEQNRTYFFLDLSVKGGKCFYFYRYHLNIYAILSAFEPEKETNFFPCQKSPKKRNLRFFEVSRVFDQRAKQFPFLSKSRIDGQKRKSF